MGLAVDRCGRLWTRRLGQAEHLAGGLVVPVAQVAHAVLGLDCQVGRMGLKALIYFEVITTIALFIGLAAINLSKAGVGVYN